MKTTVFAFLSLLTFSIYGKNMNTPEQVVTGLFTATDQHEWNQVEQSFHEEVVLDYSSLNGNPAATLSPADIVAAWKGFLPGFDYTHHQVGNFKVSVSGDQAAASCYGTASHTLGQGLWQVVGTYDFQLLQSPAGNWKISAMKFNFKYQDGDTDLPERAGAKMNARTAEQNKASVQAFFKALEAEDVDQLVSLFAENGRQVNPYASGLFPEGAIGKQGIRDYWTPVFANFDGMSFPIEELYAMEDPSLVFVKYQGKIKLKDGAGFYENDYYSTFKFDADGLIAEYVEIFNPIVAARGFGLIDQIQSSNQVNMKKVSFESQGAQLVGNLYLPPHYDGSQSYPAIVVSGSWTTVKEQMAGLYAEQLANEGFITLAFDFRNFGESEGEPRFYESPSLKREDVESAVAFLAGLEVVDADRIGAFGVCAGAMYTLMAASETPEIKAVVTAASWLHDAEAVKLFYGGEEGVKARIAAGQAAKQEYKENGAVAYIPTISAEDSSAAMYGPYDYYLNPERGAIAEWSADQFAVMSWEDWLTTDPMPTADKLQAPTLMIHSDGAVLPQYTKNYFERIAAPDKRLHWMETELESPYHQFNYYDQDAEVQESVAEAVKWFREKL